MMAEYIAKTAVIIWGIIKMNRMLSSKELHELRQQIGHIRRMEKRKHIKRSVRTKLSCIAIVAGSN